MWVVHAIPVIAFAPAPSTSSDPNASGVLVVSRADGAAPTPADQERMADLADRLAVTDIPAFAGTERIIGIAAIVVLTLLVFRSPVAALTLLGKSHRQYRQGRKNDITPQS